MTSPELERTPYWNERLAAVLSHLFLVGMMLSIAISVVQFGERLFPSWRGGYLYGLTVAITLGAILGSRFLRGVSAFQGDWFVYRAAELVVLAVSIRMWLYLLHGIGQLQADMEAWGFQISNYFKDAEYLTVLAYSVLIWVVSSAFSGDLANMEGDLTIVDRDAYRFALQDRNLAKVRIVNRVFLVGIFLIVLSALVRADIGILWQDRPSIQGGGLNVLVYFLLGLLLFSMSHFSSLRALWIWDRFSMSQKIAKNWIISGLLFLLGIGVFASLLPTRYSLGFLDLLTYLIAILFYGLNYLFSILWSLIFLLIYLLTQILASGFLEQPNPEQNFPPFQPPPPEPLPPGVDASPWQTFTSLVFWVIFLTAVYYAFYFYLRQHRDKIAWVREIAVFEAINQGWRWLGDLFSGWKRVMGAAIQEGVGRILRINLPDSRGRLKPIRLINPLRLSPRLRVIFFYLALIRRGRREGLPRQASQTPYEYAQSLEKSLPEVDSEVYQLTQTFVRARYSRSDIDQEEARLARHLWGKIQRAFRLK